MATTLTLLPQFRARRAGVIVNVTSSATLAPMLLAVAYTAGKAAFQDFTGSLAHEQAEFNICVKLVESGYRPTTRFTYKSGEHVAGLMPEAYAPLAQSAFAATAKPGAVTKETDGADLVWRAANDASTQPRFPAGPDAVALVKSGAWAPGKQNVCT